MDNYILASPKSEAISDVAASLRERIVAAQSSQRRAMKQLLAGGDATAAAAAPTAGAESAPAN